MTILLSGQSRVSFPLHWEANRVRVGGIQLWNEKDGSTMEFLLPIPLLSSFCYELMLLKECDNGTGGWCSVYRTKL